MGQAIADFTMMEQGDRVMVCVSGGKDSYGLLDILLALQNLTLTLSSMLGRPLPSETNRAFRLGSEDNRPHSHATCSGQGSKVHTQDMLLKGRFASIPSKLRSDDEQHIVIRPFAYVENADLAWYADLKQFPIIPCNLCGHRIILSGKIRSSY